MRTEDDNSGGVTTDNAHKGLGSNLGDRTISGVTIPTDELEEVEVR